MDPNELIHKKEDKLIDELCIIVYFGGTASSFRNNTTQIELFGIWTKAIELKDLSYQIHKESLMNNKHYKLLFDGCGVTNGLSGTVFAAGLAEQCEKVLKFCGEFSKHCNTLKVTSVGLSRGGMACMLLAKKIQQKIDKKKFGTCKIEMNLMLFDPVPGNSISIGKIDFTGISTVNKCFDLSKVFCLKKVLALYPHEPLPSYYFHAPVFPKYPQDKGIIIEEEVILGCHQGAVFGFSCRTLDQRISYLRIKEFLVKCGVPFSKESPSNFFVEFDEKSVLHEMNNYISEEVMETSRDTHSGKKIKRKKIANYLNKWHERLCLTYENIRDQHKETYLLVIEK
eukprot:TRINITY_DN587_c0_g1_i1.p1 TRINITY_DN587_c0_g1~~TRINITY_DN587_c0_g1_i1.p1  ORF type:complete len:340 (-),score=57.23 TRINITY_DN587_c0_g1_i1:56-1075(-)